MACLQRQTLDGQETKSPASDDGAARGGLINFTVFLKDSPSSDAPLRFAPKGEENPDIGVDTAPVALGTKMSRVWSCAQSHSPPKG